MGHKGKTGVGGGGTVKNIESPQKLLQLFNEYKEWVKENPFLVHDFVGKDAVEVFKQKQRPITWQGFEGYLSERGIVSQLGQYERNKDNSYSDYLPIISHIKAQTSANIIDGAMSGVYNANLAARLQGLVDRSDVTTDGDKVTQNVIIDWGKINTGTEEQ
jgi:hypothetical protein